MTTTEEQIHAQRGAFTEPKRYWWHHHLMGPDQMEHFHRLAREGQTAINTLHAVKDAVLGPQGGDQSDGALIQAVRKLVEDANDRTKRQ
jgi:hypothetical protein